MAKLKLIDAIKAKFTKPEDALAALGLDAATIAMDAVVHDPKTGQFTGPKAVQHHLRQQNYHESEAAKKGPKGDLHSAAAEAHASAGEAHNVPLSKRNHSEARRLSDVARRASVKTYQIGKPSYDAKSTPHVAGDSKEKVPMPITTKWSPTALVAMGALHNYLAPRLAQDSAVDLGAILKGVTAKNLAARRPFITTEIRRAVVGNLAQDADVEDLPAMLDQIESLAGEASAAVGGGESPMADTDDYKDDKDADAGNDPEDKPMADEGGGEDDASEIRDFLADKLSPEDLDTVCAMMKAKGSADEGETPMEKRDDMLDKKAMDAAIQAAITANDAKHFAIAEAQRIVRPYVGDLAVAFDSAEQVYRHTLDALGVPTKGLHKDALPAILAVQPKPGARPQQNRIAQDAAAAKGFSERFPGAARIGTM